MYILGIETTGKYASAAIIDKDKKIIEAKSIKEMNHLSEIILLIDKCVKAVDIDKNDISMVAASVGPGSFTGIRIGVSTARAISEALEIPCISVSSLEGLAISVYDNTPIKYCATIINARRKQLYGALWEKKEDRLKPVLAERQYLIDEFLLALKSKGISAGDVVFTGDGVDAYLNEILESDNYSIADESWRYQCASSISKAAFAKKENNIICTYDELLPNYMRKSEAEMRLEEGMLSSKIGGSR